jgi:hypothetical protein
MKAKIVYLAKRNPAVAAEDWPKHWRSHPRFVSQFPSLGGSIERLRYCARVLAPSVDGQPASLPEATLDYDGSAILTGASHEAMRGDVSDEDLEKIWDDERRVFSALTPTFSFHCVEKLIHGDEAPTEVAVLRFVARKPGLSREDFLARWNGAHADHATAAADASGVVRRYVQNELIRDPPPAFAFDAISETWFDSVEDAVRAFDVCAPAQGAEAFTDPSRSVTMLTYVVYKHPRPAAERAA